MIRTVVISALVLVAATLPPGGTFLDDDGNTHEGSIEAIAAENITVGCNPPANDLFCPQQVVTRGQMAAFIARGKNLKTTSIDSFSDDDGHTFEDEINQVAAAGVTLGCNPPTNDRFCPDSPMTRGQMAAMLVRTFDYPIVDLDFFDDDSGHTFETDINRIAASKVTLGCNPPDNDRFCPNDPVTRDEMATFLTRALELSPTTPPRRIQELVDIEPRETWGARPAQPGLMTTHTVDQVTVHHAGTQSGTTGINQIKGWQNFHLDGRGWGDIAYHLIIGIDGTVYEGRDRDFEGDTGTTYDTTGHFLVVVEGNFNFDHPTPAQIDSLVAVLAGAALEYGVSPSTITGHRDHAATTCPGTHLGALIDSGEIEHRVSDRIDAGGVDLVWP